MNINNLENIRYNEIKRIYRQNKKKNLYSLKKNRLRM